MKFEADSDQVKIEYDNAILLIYKQEGGYMTQVSQPDSTVCIHIPQWAATAIAEFLA